MTLELALVVYAYSFCKDFETSAAALWLIQLSALPTKHAFAVRFGRFGRRIDGKARVAEKNCLSSTYAMGDPSGTLSRLLADP